jgi:high-affinity nickel permease
MRNKLNILAYRVAGVSAAVLLVASRAVKAVDPTLTDVATTFATHVSSILTFVVAVLGGFILASLVPMGLKKILQLIKRLMGKV